MSLGRSTSAVLTANAEPRNALPGAAIVDQERLLSVAEQPPITPLSQRGHHHHQVFAHGSEYVFVVRPVLAHVNTFEDAFIDEVT